MADKLWPNLVSNIERPLRYRPDNGDFVIENGTEFFNRPLYGGNTAFRVDAGDRPEFVLYLPGRGGNLRLGIRKVERADPSALAANQRVGGNALHHEVKWLHEAATIEARYRPGMMLYTIRDPLLGADGVVKLAAIALAEAEGLILRIEAEHVPTGVELVWAYGGINGQRGKRDGDIGTENVPISEWFRLQPEFCRGNLFETGAEGFILRAPLPRGQSATIRGFVPTGATQATADAGKWNEIGALFADVGPAPRDKLGALSQSNGLAAGPGSVADEAARRPAAALQVVTGRVPLANATPLFLALQRIETPAPVADLDTYREVTAPQVERADPSTLASEKRAGVSAFHPGDLPAVFARAEEHFAKLRQQIVVETPDPFINAAVGALNVAADAVWDEPQQAIMHGAIAWRTKLLGWRGPYALDALGWTDRARKHFEYWATRQNTTPIPDKLAPPDANANLARSETALHSNGDLSNSHYDMNLVFIDALFRHLLWTGDVEFAKKMWPVIERHLAWERRLFRREFEVNGQKLPLYEAYAAIWASDDLQYHGGGAAHASAYNHWHNQMAARVAKVLGHDPAPYEQEAGLIARGMRELLWTGTHYAEFKDYLGRQLVHSSEGLWTFYHAADAGLVFESMADRIARRATIPVRGPGVPTDDDYGMLPTTDWLPYTWSLNNVVMSENVHTALALWRGARPVEAFRLLKSSLLASMYMGISPGNVGSMNYLDVYRRESQRDFADGSGVLSRALVEGLFGVHPDALEGRLLLRPGLPGQWDHARLVHPLVTLGFRREGRFEIYEVGEAPGQFHQLALDFRARAEECRIVIEGPGLDRPRQISATGLTDAMRFNLPWKHARTIRVEWMGAPIADTDRTAGMVRIPVPEAAPEGWTRLTGTSGRPLEPVELMGHFNDRVTEIFRSGKYVSPRSPFVSLALPAQGIGYWAGHVNATAEIDDAGLRAAAAAGAGRITLPNGVPFATPGPDGTPNILFVSQWDNYPREATLPLAGQARRVHLLMAGSTNVMQSRLDNGEVVVTYTDGTTTRLALRNPDTWWPIEQDYFLDDYQFRVAGPLPARVDLKTGRFRELELAGFAGQGRTVPGGAATVLELPLDPTKELRSLTVRALANEVVIGLMAVTLER